VFMKFEVLLMFVMSLLSLAFLRSGVTVKLGCAALMHSMCFDVIKDVI